MAEVKIIWDGAVMENLLHGPDGMVGRWMFGRAEIVKQAAVRQCNKRTTLLSRSILKRPVESTVGGLSITIGAYQPYAAYVHEGTKPHNIPNAFGWGKSNVAGWGYGFGIGGRFDGFFHPGYKGNPFLSDNLKLFFT